MKKLAAFALLILLLLSACSPSPTAVIVGGNKIDASEYAFYLNYNRQAAQAATLTPGELTERARQAAIEQITTGEVVRLKCKELGLKLTAEQKQALADEKEALIEMLGGKAKYLEYLNANALTDRCYDKFQQSAVYYDMLYEHAITELEPELYTDQALRHYFGENYILVKYVCIGLLDEEGNRFDAQQAAEQRRLANEAHALISAGSSFDEVIAEYNDDPVMFSQPGGIAVSRLEIAGREWLLEAFSMKNGEVSGVLAAQDGYYIIKRIELSAGYFEANREYITLSAQQFNFARRLDEWKSDAQVTVKKVVDKITLANLHEYVK